MFWTTNQGCVSCKFCWITEGSENRDKMVIAQIVFLRRPLIAGTAGVVGGTRVRRNITRNLRSQCRIYFKDRIIIYVIHYSNLFKRVSILSANIVWSMSRKNKITLKIYLTFWNIQLVTSSRSSNGNVANVLVLSTNSHLYHRAVHQLCCWDSDT